MKDDRIELRPFVWRDAADAAKAVLDSEKTVGAWMPWWKPDYSETDAIAWFKHCDEMREQGLAYEYGIFCLRSGQLLGSVGVNQIDQMNRVGNLGYWVKESCQGQGIATRASKLLIDTAFLKLKLIRLEIVVLVANTASQKVAEKLGAIYECTALNRLFHKGEPYAAKVYALIPTMALDESVDVN